MLAAERRGELGIARAIGTRRGQLVQMFLFEGAAYDLLAAAVGAASALAVAFGDGARDRRAPSAESGLVTIRYGVTLAQPRRRLRARRAADARRRHARRLAGEPAQHRRRRPQPAPAADSRPAPALGGWLSVACSRLGAGLIASAYSTQERGVAAARVVAGLVRPGARALRAAGRPASGSPTPSPALRPGLESAALQGLQLDRPRPRDGLLGVPARRPAARRRGHVGRSSTTCGRSLAGLMWVFGRSKHAAPVVKTAIADRCATGSAPARPSACSPWSSSRWSPARRRRRSFLAASATRRPSAAATTSPRRRRPRQPDPRHGPARCGAPGHRRSPTSRRMPPSRTFRWMRARSATELRRLRRPRSRRHFLRHNTYGFAARATGYDSDRAVGTRLRPTPASPLWTRSPSRVAPTGAPASSRTSS